MAHEPYGMNPGGGGLPPAQPPNPYAPPGAPGVPGVPNFGPAVEAPGAKQALILGIVAFFCCGILIGPMAIVSANKAKRAIAMDPTLTGGGMATAGLVLGIIAMVLQVLALIARLALLR